MKNSFNKILNNKNVKIIIPLIALVVIAIVLIVYFREYQYNNYRNKTNHEFYQYFSGLKVEYEASLSLNKDKEIKGFVPKDLTINYESIPIYFKDEKKVIFPSELSIIFPLKNNTYKIKEFSYLQQINNIHYLTFEDYYKNLDHFILFDGNNLYFFSDSVSFKVNNEVITLSPMSYVIANPNEFSYYDYESDVYNTLELSDVTLSNEYYSINVSNDYVVYQTQKMLLSNDLGFLTVLK